MRFRPVLSQKRSTDRYKFQCALSLQIRPFYARHHLWHSGAWRFRLFQNLPTPAEIDQHFGGSPWMTNTAVSSCSNRLKPLIVSMKPCAPSLSTDDHCKKSRSGLAIKSHRCARWSIVFGRKCRTMIFAPFCSSAHWTACKSNLCRRRRLAGNAGDRRPASAEPDSRALLAHARGRTISLLAPARARAVRSTGKQRWVSRLRNDSSDQRIAEFAGPQALGQRTSQSYQRFQLRPSDGAVCRSQHSAEEVLCNRVLVWNGA